MLTSAELEQLAVTFAFVAEMPANDRDALSRQGVCVTLAENTPAFGIGSLCESFLLVTKGQVRVAVASDEGRELMLYRVRPGESCLLTTSCLMGNNPYPANGIAETQVRAVVLPEPLFQRLLVEVPAFREFVFATFSGRIAVLMGLIQEVAFNRLDRRVAKYLLSLKTESITHHTIASELGTVREIISRILKSYETDGLLRLARNRIVILDRPKLETISAIG
jgi:CRP/FNR family transcriptional regulator